jgi:pSer/pThr/pTyr-binding forkhead associated (FHA) protein
MSVYMLVRVGTRPARLLRLDAGDTLVGRHEECRLRIPSGDVSRRHCLLRVREDRLIVSDLDSSNGTLLNGRPVVGKQEAVPGDRIQIGPVTLEMRDPNRRRKSTASTSSSTDIPEVAPALPEVLPAVQDVMPLKLARVASTEDVHVGELEQALGSNQETDEAEVLPVDEADRLHLPEMKELRDILSGLDDDA